MSLWVLATHDTLCQNNWLELKSESGFLIPMFSQTSQLGGDKQVYLLPWVTVIHRMDNWKSKLLKQTLQCNRN